MSDRYTFVYRRGGQDFLRNGFVFASGGAAMSADCPIAASGAIGCDPELYPFQTFTNPGSLDTSSITSRYAFRYLAAGEHKLHNGFVTDDGAMSYQQICDIEAGVIDCDPTTHPLQGSALPPAGLEGKSIGSRYSFIFVLE